LGSSYPKGMSDAFEPSEQFVTEVQRATSNKLKIVLFAAGEVVPGLQVFDAVAGGRSIELGWTYAGYYFGKEPALAAIGGDLPLGLNAVDFVRWLEGTGQVARDRLFAELGVKAFPCSIVGARGLWLRKQVSRVDDMRGLKLRVGGVTAAALQSMEVIPQQVAGGDIYPALESGTIDGATFLTPNIDEQLGFNKVAKYYYYPFGEPSFSIISDLIINTKIWNDLEPAAKAVIQSSCQQQLRNDVRKLSNGATPEASAALDRMRAGGTIITPLPDPIAARYRSSVDQKLDREIKSPAGLEVWHSLKTAR
jgi:TRAP-type mannitol/chloroaromatic compound transport system substrate-binding protein